MGWGASENFPCVRLSGKMEGTLRFQGSLQWIRKWGASRQGPPGRRSRQLLRLPHDLALYAVLRKAHTVLAYLFFLTILAHVGAVWFHTLIVRDGMFLRMAPWNLRPPQPASPAAIGQDRATEQP